MDVAWHVRGGKNRHRESAGLARLSRLADRWCVAHLYIGSSRRSRGHASFLRRLRQRDLGIGAAMPLVRSRPLSQGRNLEMRISLDLRRHRLDPPVAVVVACLRVLGTVTGYEALDFAIHPDVTRHALEEMAPSVVRPHATFRNSEPVHPFADPFGDLLELRITRGSAATAIR